MKELQLFEFLGNKVLDADGKYAGRIEEIEVERGDEVCAVKSYLVERRGVLDRLQTWVFAAPIQKSIPVREKSKPYRVPWDKMDLSDPRHPRILVPQSELSRIRPTKAE
jgi:sporulation protein YlmC with PRC-barrel domain